MRNLLLISLLLVGCGQTTRADTDGGGGLDAASATDGGVAVDAGGQDGGLCEPILCGLECEHGLRRTPEGCELCECNPPPVDSCADDGECVLARVTTSCCGCDQAYPRARVDSEPCLVERGAPVPPGCLPDPEICATVDCAACAPAVRAFCDGGSCASSTECADGDVPFRLGCAPACTAHADCVLGADYGSCCGGCQAAPRAYLDDDPCFAERASDTRCAPAPGSCDGLGCPSPANDCTMFGSAVCMADGTCREGGADGACPFGTHEDGDVCAPD